MAPGSSVYRTQRHTWVNRTTQWRKYFSNIALVHCSSSLQSPVLAVFCFKVKIYHPEQKLTRKSSFGEREEVLHQQTWRNHIEKCWEDPCTGWVLWPPSPNSLSAFSTLLCAPRGHILIQWEHSRREDRMTLICQGILSFLCFFTAIAPAGPPFSHSHPILSNSRAWPLPLSLDLVVITAPYYWLLPSGYSTIPCHSLKSIPYLSNQYLY